MAAAATIPAVVSHEPQNGLATWKYEQVSQPRKINDDELLVRVVAVGICHSDIFIGSVPGGVYGYEYPKILGHEGAGYVEAVGSKVTAAEKGDPVLLSFNFCDSCELCQYEGPAYCENFHAQNSVGDSATFQTTDKTESKPVGGKFFGQSSFASLTVVSEKCVINVKNHISNIEDLKLSAPLGCGLMTGSGLIHNASNLQPQDILMVVGIGAVGLGAIMTAKMQGCRAIIAVDRIESRLTSAKELGATHTYNTTSGTDFVKDVQGLVSNKRITVAIDTTGHPPIIEQILASLGKRGKLFQIGVPALDATASVPLFDFFVQGKTYEANFLGSAKAKEYVPMMLEWAKEGKFPFQKIVKFYSAKDIATAMEDMRGPVIKPVLLFDE